MALYRFYYFSLISTRRK